jgi:hypothetical protein
MRALLLTLSAGLTTSAFAQSTTSQAPAPLSTYVRVVQADSVHLFYSADYGMVQPACAVVRRHVRLDASGSFQGRFRDYQVAGDSLLQAGTYEHGKKQGPFQSYHPNGRLAARGQYVADQPSGLWQYWYASGQQRQVLHFGDAGLVKVVDAWAEDGQPTVSNGAGSWQGVSGPYRLGGPVLQGRPDGRWEAKSPNGSVVLAETFAGGQFKSGRQFVSMPGTQPTYKDASRLSLVETPAFQAAEAFRLLPPCQPKLAAGAAATNGNFAPAAYKQGMSAYTELLWVRLRPVMNTATGLGEYYGVLTFAVRLDAAGNWATEPEEVQGTSEAAAKELLAIMRRLPRWQPAQLDGRPVASRVAVTFRAIRPTYNLSLAPGRAL